MNAPIAIENPNLWKAIANKNITVIDSKNNNSCDLAANLKNAGKINFEAIYATINKINPLIIAITNISIEKSFNVVITKRANNANMS